MAKEFTDIVREKTDEELAEMGRQVARYIPPKQRTIQAEIERREEQARHDEIIRAEARKVTKETLEDWFKGVFEPAPLDGNNQASDEDIIAGALDKLVSAGRLTIPKDGYLVTGGKSGVEVKPAAKNGKAPKKD